MTRTFFRLRTSRVFPLAGALLVASCSSSSSGGPGSVDTGVDAKTDGFADGAVGPVDGGGDASGDALDALPDTQTDTFTDATSDAAPITAAAFDRQAAIDDCIFEAHCGIIGASEEKACEAAIDAPVVAAPPYTQAGAYAAGHLGFDPVAAAACLAIRATRGCTADLQLAAGAICDPVYTPAVAIGAACAADAECEDGYCARAENARDGCTGACTTFPPVGKPCLITAPCAPDAFCDTTTNLCVARGKTGDACGSNGPFCQADLFCAGVTDTTPGVCGGRQPLGATCEFSLFGSSCTLGLYCDGSSSTNVCRARVGQGTACASYDACDDGLDCVGLAFDDNGNVTTAGACAPFLDAASACKSTLTEAGCPSDMTCSASTSKCAATGGLGSDCSATGSDGTCADGLYCDAASERCKARLAGGTACTARPEGDDNVCVETTQCDGTSKTCTLICE